MAAINVSDKQKQRVIEAATLVEKKLGTAISQATAVEMGIALLQEKYSRVEEQTHASQD